MSGKGLARAALPDCFLAPQVDDLGGMLAVATANAHNIEASRGEYWPELLPTCHAPGAAQPWLKAQCNAQTADPGAAASWC